LTAQGEQCPNPKKLESRFFVFVLFVISDFFINAYKKKLGKTDLFCFFQSHPSISKGGDESNDGTGQAQDTLQWLNKLAARQRPEVNRSMAEFC